MGSKSVQALQDEGGNEVMQAGGNLAAQERANERGEEEPAVKQLRLGGGG